MCGTKKCEDNCNFEPYRITVGNGAHSREKEIGVCAGRRIKNSIFSKVEELVDSSAALGMTVSLTKI